MLWLFIFVHVVIQCFYLLRIIYSIHSSTKSIRFLGVFIAVYRHRISVDGNEILSVIVYRLHSGFLPRFIFIIDIIQIVIRNSNFTKQKTRQTRVRKKNI